MSWRWSWLAALALLPAACAASALPESDALFGEDDECSADSDSCGLSLRQLRGEKASAAEAMELQDFLESETDEEDEELETLNETSEGGVYTFYAYRSKTNAGYEDQNVNMGNLAGAMWYLHNEVVGHCPRKFGITRMLRYKITMKPTPELERTGKNYAPLCHFDSGACTGPLPVLKDYSRFGYVVGCDKPNFQRASYYHATWYSFPGDCPSKPIQAKSAGCDRTEKGGLCKPGEPWSRTCTWRKEYAGEITLDELTHNKNFDERCHKGFYEYDENKDKGMGTNFWHGRGNWRVCNRRMSWAKTLFARKYPQFPKLPEAPECPFGDPKR
eukprot:gb/GFBE01030244.1/.p1 GENE.gb/GFBE01030244.1/~~gb/GFBE01030244.1/.p1  ORF type:complete len:329 (+),score=70.92 gb/GFBE01030244.1/:1-987(+)